MDPYKQAQAAITGASQVQAPTSDPALAALFGSSFQLAQSNRGVGGLGTLNGVQAQTDENAQRLAMQEKADEVKAKAQQLKDLQDKNKYEKVRKDDGGFDFYNPLGQKIDIHQFSQVTGKSVADVLKDSENNLDLQFQQDYKTMQDIANAYANGDKEFLDKLAEDSGDKAFFKGKTAADVMKLFRQGYPTIYGQQGQGTNVRPVEQAPTFTGGGQAQSEAQPNFLQQLMGFFNRG
jgi:hypothetical protein